MKLLGFFAFAGALVLHSAKASDVVAITESSWDDTVKSGTWMVEFYAPWCAHCKAFAPVWDEAAKKLSPAVGVKFGKVDATYETALATRFKVKSYPKIYYLPESYAKDDQYREFKGGRNLESVEKFVYKVTGPPIPKLKAETAKAFKAQSDVVFVSVGTEVGQATKDLADKYLDSIYIAQADDTSLLAGVTAPKKLPAVVALDATAEGTDDYAQWYEEGSEHTLEEFVLAHQFPPMVALARKNFWQIANAGKMVLLAIVDPGSATQKEFLATCAKVARRNVYDVRSGWLDGVEWEKYVKELFLVTPEQVQQGATVIYDAPNKQFYAKGLPKTEAELQAFIDDTLAKKIPPTNTERGVQKAAKRVFVQFAEFLEENPWAMVLLFLPIFGLGYLVFRSSGDDDDGADKATAKED